MTHPYGAMMLISRFAMLVSLLLVSLARGDEGDKLFDDDWAAENDSLLGGIVPSPKKSPLTLQEAKRKKCNLEPPFLYFTFHDAGKVTKFSRDGCFLEDQVLRGPILGPGRPEFRQMALGPYKDMKNVLYIAQAHADQPQIMVFGECTKIEDETKEMVSYEQEVRERENGLGDATQTSRALNNRAQFLDNGPVKTGQREMIAIITGNNVEDNIGEQFGKGVSWHPTEAAKHAFGVRAASHGHGTRRGMGRPLICLVSAHRHCDALRRS